MLLTLASRKQRWTSPFKQLLLNSYIFNHFYSTTSNDITESQPSQSTPPPIQVLLTESTGRGVFATRKIGSGELIHTAQPFVCHPYFSSLHTVCYFCLKKLANGDNSGVNFCGDSCRKQAMGFCEVENQADWSAFDTHCRTRGLKYPLLVRRLACMVLSGVASSNSLDILQPAILSPQMIALMEEEFGLLRCALLDADLTGEKMAFLTKQWYIGVLARIRINAFRIELVGGSYEDLLLSASSSVNAEAAVGSAIYMLPSFYNHDCDPNVHILWIENVNARVKALRDIEEGEELRICYIDASMNYKARQTLLSEGFGFQCHCLRCLSYD
ncbi:hypothetical protein DCAR_0519499 [Daucus carota subsp. sativus]|uniref:SET domain-containing protein n=1 Tax=Daucus carota subsp. sativus TaxID=79200 RepID=A0AAF1B1E6_DAUCS|nr:PREDICTED: histone-lysine N-methyltransferase ATXR4 [Daucus carota subsp. sativus]WOH00141.1 hypothetical protein DCAR_0519499 [Daucus carota subsp. sativus]